MIRKTLLACVLSLGLCVTPQEPLFAEEGHDHEHGAEEEGHGEHGDEHEEGIELSAEELAKRGVTLEQASPREIAKTLSVNAKVSASNDKLAHLHPRFSGLMKEVRKQVGEKVSKGEVVAVVESNQSLQRYEVTSLIDGTVIYRHATLGEFVDETRPILVIADLSTVWVDLHVFPRDFSAIKLGQTVRITAAHAPTRSFTSKITFTSGVVDEASQARVARAVVDNADGVLLPDQYVNAEVILDAYPVKVAVRSSALQRNGEQTVVFVKGDHGFAPKEVVIGRSDSQYAEVLSGIEPGEEYAAGNTFILKAELAKASAKHEH